MEYEIWKTLAQAGPVDQDPDMPAPGNLLVGVNPAIMWQDDHSSYGYNDVALYPAFHNGERCWVKESGWNPAPGYSASGVQQDIITYDAGIKILVDNDVYGPFFDKGESQNETD